MPYQPDTIAKVVSRLNIRYFLPAIQREFVWSPDQIIQLFDSLMRGYPISTFLFWELKPENRERWDIYRFIENFHVNDTHNARGTTAGVQQLTLVLDGQQRLTSLLIGLKGSYTVKKKYLRWDRPDAWVRHTLYLDLFKDSDAEPEDNDLGLRYGFAFLPEHPHNDATHYWFKVSRILDFDSEDRFDKFKYEEQDSLPDSVTRGQQRVFQKNLDRLFRAIWRNDVISYYTEEDQDYDRVLDIFVRANEGGTKLSKSDLLLSMATSRWSMNAREEIYGFVERINNDLIRKNDFDKDFIMKTCLVLTDLPVQYKANNFSKQNLDLIEQHWGQIKAAIEEGINLINWFGIDRDTLTSANALIPIIYYLYQHQVPKLRGATSKAERWSAKAMRRWLLGALLNGLFGGQSDNMLRDTRRILQEHAGDGYFPISALAEIAKERGRPSFADGAVQDFLAITYGRRETFLALSLLSDFDSWGAESPQQDHIFPRSLFTPAKLRNSGLRSEVQARYQDLCNRIGNLQLLLARENGEKSDGNLLAWLSTRDTAFREKQLIPRDDALLTFDRFEDFIRTREELIRDRLRMIFGTYYNVHVICQMLQRAGIPARPWEVEEHIQTQRGALRERGVLHIDQEGEGGRIRVQTELHGVLEQDGPG